VAAEAAVALGARTQSPSSALAVPLVTIRRALGTRHTAASMSPRTDPHLGLVLPISLAASACAGTRRPRVQGPLALLALCKASAAQAAAILVPLVANNAIPVACLVAQSQMGGL